MTSTPLPKGVQISGEKRDNLGVDLAARYRAGATIRNLRDDTGRSFGFIRRLLLEHDVVLRPRGGNGQRR